MKTLKKMVLKCQVGRGTCKDTGNDRIFKEVRLERNQGEVLILNLDLKVENGGRLSLTKIIISDGWELRESEARGAWIFQGRR